MKTFIFTLCLLISSPAFAWDERHTLWTVSTVAIVADWGTTLDIENHSDQHETNARMGTHPPRFEVNRHFTVLMLLHGIGNYAIQQIPKNSSWYTFLLYSENIGITLGHGTAALNNVRLGLSLNF